MAFWTATEEPNRQFRWYIEFNGAASNMTNMRYLLKKAAKPTMKISEVTHKYLNHTFYYPGRLEWDPISISFASAVADKKLGTQTIWEALQQSGYIFPTSDGTDSPEKLKTISKARAVEQLTNAANNSRITLVQINADGKPVEKWYLFNPFFTDIKYDSLEYGSEDIMNIDCTIKYDYATLDIDDGKQLTPDTPADYTR